MRSTLFAGRAGSITFLKIVTTLALSKGEGVGKRTVFPLRHGIHDVALER